MRVRKPFWPPPDTFSTLETRGLEWLHCFRAFAGRAIALRREQGRAQELEPALRGFVQQYPLVPAWRTGLAYLYSELGREAETREQFEFMAADNFAALPNDANWSVGAALLAQACAFLGDAERAAVLYARMLPHATRSTNVGAGAGILGCLSRPLGLLATTLWRWEDAERHFRYALDVHARMGASTWLAWTHYSYAEMLHRRHAEGDREKALEQVNSALDIAQDLGMKALLERALALKIEVQGISSTDINTSIDAVASLVFTEKPDLKKHAAPDGTVTIMFSDIEGSTAMADRLGDKRFMDVLREHNAIVREQVKSHGGFEVKSEGDGFMVAFQSAGKALACASAIQKALLARNDSAAEPVKVRMGLHAGEVIKEGEDFFGRNVIMAARVASHANGGEILTSGVVKALLSGSDVTWGDSRTVVLKGLSGEHEIWAVEWTSR
jgi:class 3 adenylate cyclase